MGRFSMDEVNNYGGSGGSGFFRLSNNGDSASVRFLYNSVDDVEGYAVHEVEINGKKRYVNCLRNYNEPKDKCPFCRENRAQRAKLFIPVYNESEGQVQIWERGKKMFAKLASLFTRYDKAPIVAQIFDVERVGEANATSTDYNFYRTDDPADDSTLEDFEVPQILGRFVLEKSAEDMEYYLEEGQFPPTDDEEEQVHPRNNNHSRRVERRTPSRVNNREDF